LSRDAIRELCRAQPESKVSRESVVERVYLAGRARHALQLKKGGQPMKVNLIAATLMAAASALCANVVVAQNMEEITVQGTRSLKTEVVDRTHTIPIVDVSLGYGVSTAGLDLATTTGVAELDKRVHDAAMAACKEIGRQYPDSTPTDEVCAKRAADKAMVKVREAAAAASKGALK
jgi:UrcA family protein